MATMTYSTLKTDIQSRLQDSSTELAAYLDEAIQLAELRLSRDLKVTAFDTTSTGAFTSSNPKFSKPSDLVTTRYIRYRTTSTRPWVTLERKTLEFCFEFFPDENSTATDPKYYSEFDDSNYYVVGIPASTYGYEIGYTRRLPALSTSTGSNTNWLTINAADALLYAACIECASFRQNERQIQEYAGLYSNAVQAINNEHTRTLRDDLRPADNITRVENIGVQSVGQA